MKIIARPRWSVGRYRQIYECAVPAGCLDPLAGAEKFYATRELRNRRRDPGQLTFTRNCLWESWLGLWSERRFEQSISVQLTGAQAGRSLICTYDVIYPYPSLHLPPWPLQKEVAELEAHLQTRPGTTLMAGNVNRESSTATAVAAKPRPRESLYRKSLRSPFNFTFLLLYRVYRSATWLTYWTKRRFTLAGQAVLGGTLVALFSGLDPDSAVGYQAFTVLLALLLLALTSGLRFRAPFDIERRLPRVATAGQPFTYRVTARNRSRRKQAGLALLEDLADPRPPFKEWREYKLDEDRHVRPFRFQRSRTQNPFKLASVKEAAVPELPAGAECDVTFELTPHRRGVVRFLGMTFARSDPLGLFRTLGQVMAPQTILVLPRRYPIPALAWPGGSQYQQGGVAMASNIGHSDEFVALRDYRPGDPQRHIHWRSWAKVGKPIVKEFEDEFFVRHALVLDTFTDRPYSDLFEEAVSVAASFACTVLTQESLLDLLFVGPQAYAFTAGRGLAHADQMLEILASVRPTTSETFATLEDLVLSHTPSVSGCICVLLDWDERRQRLVEKIKAANLPVLVLVVRAPGATQPLAPGPMLDAPKQLHALEVGKIEAQLAVLT